VRFKVEGVEWTSDEKKTIDRANVTYTEYIIFHSFVKLSDASSRTLAIVSANRYLTNDCGLTSKHLHEQIQKNIAPIVHA